MTRRTSIFLVLGFSLGRLVQAEPFPYRATVVAIENLTHDTKLVRLRLAHAEGFRFTPGQYTFLQVPEDYVREWNKRYGTAHTKVARPYSFASSSSRLPLFDLIIKLAPAPPGKDVPPGLATTYVHTRLRPGDELWFSPPAGKLYLRQDTGRPIVIVAGGSGAAPFVSLLEYWFENRFDRNNEIYFFFGVRSKRDLFYHERFQQWARARPRFHYLPALSSPEPGDGWRGETGFIQTAVEKHLASPSDADAYLAGPPVMLREVVKVLNAKGIGRDRIHYDEIAVR